MRQKELQPQKLNENLGDIKINNNQINNYYNFNERRIEGEIEKRDENNNKQENNKNMNIDQYNNNKNDMNNNNSASPIYGNNI